MTVYVVLTDRGVTKYVHTNRKAINGFLGAHSSRVTTFDIEEWHLGKYITSYSREKFLGVSKNLGEII